MPKVVRLLLALFTLEDEFDEVLTRHHVEDVHMDKRIFIISASEGVKMRDWGM